MISWLLEPVNGVQEVQVRKELAKLREGNATQWAIAEVLERMYAVCELVLCVSVGAWNDEAETSDLSAGVQPAQPGVDVRGGRQRS